MRPGGLFCALMIMAARPAMAQRVTVLPSIGVSQVFDDNVYYQPANEPDVITRFSPRIDIADVENRITWQARYALDAERFQGNPELSTAHARQDAAIDARVAASRRLTLTGGASFLESQAAVDLTESAAAPIPGRLHAQRFAISQTTTADLCERTQMAFTYDAANDRLAGRGSQLSQTATSTLERRVSPRSSMHVEYSYQRFDFQGAGAKDSQLAIVGLMREVTRAARVVVRAGPRLTAGVLSPEIAASFDYRLRSADAALTYSHSTTAPIGLHGLADTHAWTATMAHERGRGVRWRGSSSVLHTTQAALSSVIYRLSAGCSRPVGRRLVVDAGYDGTRQSGNIYSPRVFDTIARNRVVLTLSVTDAQHHDGGVAR